MSRRVGQAARLPQSGTRVAGFAAVRQFALQRFRYLVITALVGREHLVIAVAHTAREPGYWRDRLK